MDKRVKDLRVKIELYVQHPNDEVLSSFVSIIANFKETNGAGSLGGD